jgi:hypothetical protein
MFHPHSESSHFATPTRKHRLAESPGAAVTPSRRPLHTLSDNDLNQQQQQQLPLSASKNNTNNNTLKPRHFVHTVHAPPLAAVPVAPSAFPSSSNYLPPSQTHLLTQLLLLIREHRVVREKAVRSAFYQWLSSSLRTARAQRPHSSSSNNDHSLNQTHVDGSISRNHQSENFNTPKKRRVASDDDAVSQRGSTTPLSAHSSDNRSGASTDRPVSLNQKAFAAATAAAAHSESLAEKLRKLDQQGHTSQTTSSAGTGRRWFADDRSDDFENVEQLQSQRVLKSGLDSQALHRAMRTMTAASQSTLARCRRSSEQEKERERERESSRVRALTSQWDHAMGLDDADDSHEIAQYIQNYSYSLPSDRPLRPLAQRDRARETQIVPLVALPMLRDKLSLWKSEYLQRGSSDDKSIHNGNNES